MIVSTTPQGEGVNTTIGSTTWRHGTESQIGWQRLPVVRGQVRVCDALHRKHRVGDKAQSSAIYELLSSSCWQDREH